MLIQLKQELKTFFGFINFEKEDIKLIEVHSDDELGMMSRIINKNIEETKANIQKDRALIADTIRVANAINKGHLDTRIQKDSNNPSLNEFKNIINEMLHTLNTNIQKYFKCINFLFKIRF